MYMVLGIVFLIISLLVVAFEGYTLIHAIVVDGEPISKKNMVYLLPSFLLIYFLYLTSSVYNGVALNFFYCITLVPYSFEMFACKPRIALIIPISTEYPLFYADFIIASVLGTATGILSVFSLFNHSIKNFYQKNKLLRHDCDIVISDSPDSLKYARNNKNCLIICERIPRQRYADLVKSDYRIMRVKLISAKFMRKLSCGEHHLIVFRDSGYSYTKLLEIFSVILKHSSCFTYLHLETNQGEMKVIKERFLSQAQNSLSSHVYCFSKYELMARKLVFDYPISKFIPRSFYNQNTTLKNDKEINVVFIGFGKVNHELLKIMSMQFQFAQEVDGKLANKPVNYYVCDVDESRMHNDFFSRVFYEFDEDFKNTDFPAPDKICNLIKPEKLDINSVKAKILFKKLVTENTYTYFIVSLSDDLADASYAQTIRRLLVKEKNYKIFVRAKNIKKEQLLQKNTDIIYFGSEEYIYSHSCIVNDELTNMSMLLNLLYHVKSKPDWVEKIAELSPNEQGQAFHKELNVLNNRAVLLHAWEELPVVEQFSNLYRSLNLPFKFGLMGLSLKKSNAQDENCITEDEFFQRCNNREREKDYAEYSFFFETNVSNVLAFIEHSRWCAYYLLSDYKQMGKNEILARKMVDEKTGNIQFAHKDSKLKLHACLTTYYGLNQLILFKWHAMFPDSSLSPSEYDTNDAFKQLAAIYAYDYIDIDNSYKQLVVSGYKIVESKESRFI